MLGILLCIRRDDINGFAVCWRAACVPADPLRLISLLNVRGFDGSSLSEP